MKRIGTLIGFLLFAAAAFGQTPVVSVVFNGASFIPSSLPNGGIAQGSIFTVKGTNLGPATPVQVFSLPLGTNLGGTTVTVVSGGTTVSAIPLYTSPGQVNIVLPSQTPIGTGSLTVTFNGATSSPVPIQIVRNSLGIFTLNQGGTGSAIVTDANYNVITALAPAAPNQVVVLWGTGLGPITTPDNTLPPALDMTQLPVDVYVGSAKVTPIYRGRGCCAGIDQIAFAVPSGQLGCNVSLAVKVNNVVSNSTTIAISNGGANEPCSDPNGFSSTLLQKLNTSGRASFGSVVLSRTSTNIALPPPLPSQSSTIDSGSASFYTLTRDAFTASQSSVSEPSIGGCSVSTFSGQASSGSTTNPFVGLDAGAFLSVTNPSGASRQLNQIATETGFYSGTLSVPPQGPFLGAGNYTVAGTGGSSIGPFQVSISGTPVTWTNSTITSVNRAQDLNITWTGGTASTFVIISGTSVSGTASGAPSATFVCFAPGAPGQFTVPSAVLLALPVSAQSGIPGFTVPGGFLFVYGYSYNFVNIPSIDSAIAAYIEGSGVSVNYQ